MKRASDGLLQQTENLKLDLEQQKMLQLVGNKDEESQNLIEEVEQLSLELMNTKFYLKKFENENKNLNGEKENLTNELECLQNNLAEYQKKYLDGKKKIHGLEIATKKIMKQNEELGKERDLFKSSTGVGSCIDSKLQSPERGVANGYFDSQTTNSGSDTEDVMKIGALEICDGQTVSTLN